MLNTRYQNFKNGLIRDRFSALSANQSTAQALGQAHHLDRLYRTIDIIVDPDDAGGDLALVASSQQRIGCPGVAVTRLADAADVDDGFFLFGDGVEVGFGQFGRRIEIGVVSDLSCLR